ncbi:hypothetical protein Ssi02_19310 [Sinosporangium siamense]|uniref:Uncharacterized protein n=1 Tax=Sinosporangium siamense TaxID=1367973 RepID=A0A919RF76_9ACTN|nr:hypothetical protein Ssi02_19310 [Sinosporangium siamense]
MHTTKRTNPTWLSEDDLNVYATQFERTGLTGALNRYRNMDRGWEGSRRLRRFPHCSAVKSGG